jgi:hypothetical protein
LNAPIATRATGFATASRDPVIIPPSLKTIETMIRMAFSGEATKLVSLVDPYSQLGEWEPWLDALA